MSEHIVDVFYNFDVPNVILVLKEPAAFVFLENRGTVLEGQAHISFLKWNRGGRENVLGKI